jgi:hypothetical protein
VTKSCAECGSPLVSISGRLLTEAIETIKPVLKSPSLPISIRNGSPPSVRRTYSICPNCDAYGLGAELTENFYRAPARPNKPAAFTFDTAPCEEIENLVTSFQQISSERVIRDEPGDDRRR